MVRREVFAARLSRLDLYLRTLRKVCDYDLERYRQDPFIHGTAERYLHLAIEALLDMGSHVIADRGFRKPDTYGDIFVVLKDEGVIPTELAEKLSGLAGFRNILVHDYLTIDHEKVYRAIREKLSDLEELGKLYSEML